MDSRRRRRCRLPASNQCFRMNNRRTAREGIASQAGLNCHGWRTKVAWPGMFRMSCNETQASKRERSMPADPVDVWCPAIKQNTMQYFGRRKAAKPKQAHRSVPGSSRRCSVSCNAEHNAIFWVAQSSQTQASALERQFLFKNTGALHEAAADQKS